MAGRFGRALEVFGNKAEQNGTRAARKVAIACLAGVSARSPVDTGHFRRNWRVGVGGADLGVSGQPGEGESGQGQYGLSGDELAAAESLMRSAKWSDTLHVSNSVPYGEFLEAGSSAQTENQPDGIVGATVDEIEAKFGALLREVRRGE